MSNDSSLSVADVLLQSAMKVVGKRELLKAVEKLFDMKKSVGKSRKKSEVPVDEMCAARVKGDRTGMKVGRYVLFESLQCGRKGHDGRLCAIHSNQVTKFGSLLLGEYALPLTEEQKKIFGEL